MRVLILGGTTEAGALVKALADRPDIRATLSLAGRTRNPVLPDLPHRIGGFGGIDGLVNWLQADRTEAVIDATHPFAAQMPVHAVAACARLGLPIAALSRPPWTPVDGDDWIAVDSPHEAAQAIGAEPRRIFLTTGRLDLDAFAIAPQHFYLVRTIDEPDPPPALPQWQLLRDRGPFDEAADFALMRDHRIDVLVTKNAGGAATYGKISAARRLRLPVVMIRRPALPPVPTFDRPSQVLGWLDALHDRPGCERGV